MVSNPLNLWCSFVFQLLQQSCRWKEAAIDEIRYISLPRVIISRSHFSSACWAFMDFPRLQNREAENRWWFLGLSFVNAPRIGASEHCCQNPWWRGTRIYMFLHVFLGDDEHWYQINIDERHIDPSRLTHSSNFLRFGSRQEPRGPPRGWAGGSWTGRSQRLRQREGPAWWRLPQRSWGDHIRRENVRSQGSHHERNPHFPTHGWWLSIGGLLIVGSSSRIDKLAWAQPNLDPMLGYFLKPLRLMMPYDIWTADGWLLKNWWSFDNPFWVPAMTGFGQATSHYIGHAQYH